MVICREGRRERKRDARRNRQFERDEDEREEKRERGREKKRLHDFAREKNSMSTVVKFIALCSRDLPTRINCCILDPRPPP